MFKTYETMKELANLCETDGDLCTITQKYQETGDPILLAYVYCEVFPFTLTQVGKYFYLGDQDKASISVEELHKSMMSYDGNKGAKLLTFYARYLNNRLLSETGMLSHQVRKANNNADCYEMALEEGKTETGYENVEFMESLKSLKLTQTEHEYCKMVGEYPNIKDTDIAKKLGISSAAITYLKKQLTYKLTPILAC